MRSDTLRALEASGPFETGDDANAAFDQALGVLVPELKELQSAVLEDLDEKTLGVGWWVSHLEVVPRTSVGDYLIEAIPAVQNALAEAALHLSELETALDGNERRFARVVDGHGVARAPKVQRGSEMLHERLSALHASGFFRAIGSALDLLAAVAIGVLAIPRNIVRADFGKLKAWFDGKQQRHPLQETFRQHLFAAIDQAGPARWSEWASHYRNMLVHRAPRAEAQYLKASAHVLDPAGRPIPRTEPVLLLVREPALTNVQALRAVERSIGSRLQGSMFLSENARTTFTETLAATTFVVRAVTPQLLAAWLARRVRPDDLRQPSEQWIEDPQLTSFDGFKPGSENVIANTMLVGGPWDRRLRASGVLDAEGASNKRGTG